MGNGFFQSDNTFLGLIEFSIRKNLINKKYKIEDSGYTYRKCSSKDKPPIDNGKILVKNPKIFY
jgi:hypothetical protein